jgi:uncharacterized protein
MHTTMETYTGLLLQLDDPKSEHVCVEDIAAGLAHTCRYSGQINKYYSVGEHSVRVAQMVLAAGHTELGLPALLHDGHEAYLGELTSMTKALVGEPYLRLADRIDKAIAEAFGFEPALFHHPAVKEQDSLLLRMEAGQLQFSRGHKLAELHGYDSILGWDPATARVAFLDAYARATDTLGAVA